MAFWRRRAAASPKRAVLHVGLHKTATTALQKMMHEGSATFATQGLYYPEASRTYYGHHLLGYEYFNPKNEEAKGALAKLVAELDNREPEAVLISSENIEHLTLHPERLVEIRDALRGLGYEISVLLTLREVGEYAEAVFAELHKHGLQVSPEDFAARIISTNGFEFNGRTFSFDFPWLVGVFDEVFGADQVDLLEYSPEIVPEMLLVISHRLQLAPIFPREIPMTNLRVTGEGAAPAFSMEIKEQIRSSCGEHIGHLLALHRHEVITPRDLFR